MTSWLVAYQIHIFITVVLMLAMAAISVTFDVFQPEYMDDSVARKIVFLINAPVGFNVAYTLWTTLDLEGNMRVLKVIVCGIASLLAAAGAPYYHRVIFALIKWKFPGFDIESAFSKKTLAITAVSTAKATLATARTDLAAATKAPPT
jgi:hypothetical protein